MALSDSPFIQKLLDKFSNSREFTISAILHVIIVAVFGTAVLFEATQEPPDFEGEGGGFVSAGEQMTAPPQQNQITPQETTFEVTTMTNPQTPALNAITTTATNPLNFEMTSMIMPTQTMAPSAADQVAAPKPTSAAFGSDGMTPQIAGQIKEFTRGWGKGTGSGTGTRNREFEFFAFIGQYSGGDWNSTIQVTGGKITHGSLPNLLYFMNKWSREKITTNYTNVRAIKLDSDELFSVKPPFIFMTGRRDFKLTEKEVQNLQKYVRMGGCIWGDSSLPGRNSRFDIAFRREMRRVIPDVDKQFEPLPKDHPIFTAGYFPEIKEVPPGLNFYQEPVYALSIYGEIGILYTANDYGDMWQIGLDEKGLVDMRRDERNQYVAINPRIWDYRYTYLGNVAPSGPAPRGGGEPVAQNLMDTYRFGTNVVVHLLTRWDRVASRAPSL